MKDKCPLLLHIFTLTLYIAFIIYLLLIPTVSATAFVINFLPYVALADHTQLFITMEQRERAVAIDEVAKLDDNELSWSTTIMKTEVLHFISGFAIYSPYIKQSW